jgi:hypothetical protein
MMPDFTPQVLRAADLAGSIPLAAPMPAAQGGGIMGELEGILQFVDRFQAQMLQFEQTFKTLKGQDKVGPDVLPPDPVGTDSYQGASRPAPVEVLVPAPEIDPVQAYGKMLGALSKLAEMDAEMTIGDALKKARDYKELIIPEIASALKELQNGNPDRALADS